MENIKNAVRLAKAASERDKNERSKQPAKQSRQSAKPEVTRAISDSKPLLPGLLSTALAKPWTPPTVVLENAHLEKHRIVSQSVRSAEHVAFNLLRTRIYQILSGHGWTSIGVTSPTAGCGKTTVAVNLAFSLARQEECKTVLIDLDLRKASVAKILGIQPEVSIGQFLEGRSELEDCFVSVGENLYFGLNDHKLNADLELAHYQRLAEIVPGIIEGLAPQVVIVDLPPMLASDDVMAFQPCLDACFLVAAAGQTTAKEIEECEAEFREEDAFLGVVLNKCTEQSEEYYQYSPF